MRALGWHTIVQDKTTCVMYGMPAAAIELKAAVEVLPLPLIGPATVALAVRRSDGIVRVKVGRERVKHGVLGLCGLRIGAAPHQFQAWADLEIKRPAGGSPPAGTFTQPAYDD